MHLFVQGVQPRLDVSTTRLFAACDSPPRSGRRLRRRNIQPLQRPLTPALRLIDRLILRRSNGRSLGPPLWNGLAWSRANSQLNTVFSESLASCCSDSIPQQVADLHFKEAGLDQASQAPLRLNLVNADRGTDLVQASAACSLHTEEPAADPLNPRLVLLLSWRRNRGKNIFAVYRQSPLLTELWPGFPTSSVPARRQHIRLALRVVVLVGLTHDLRPGLRQGEPKTPTQMGKHTGPRTVSDNA